MPGVIIIVMLMLVVFATVSALPPWLTKVNGFPQKKVEDITGWVVTTEVSVAIIILAML